MSRIGNAPVLIPEGVTINVEKGNKVSVKGPKGELVQKLDPDLTVSIDNGELVLKRPTDQKRHREVHGLYRAIIQNMVIGVSEGFKRQLELHGVGYRVNNSGNLLELSLGYSHPIYFYIPDELQVQTVTEKGKEPTIVLEGVDNQLLGQVAAKIKSFRKTEPYKGKGIRFKGEYIRRKAGKTAG